LKNSDRPRRKHDGDSILFEFERCGENSLFHLALAEGFQRRLVALRVPVHSLRMPLVLIRRVGVVLPITREVVGHFCFKSPIFDAFETVGSLGIFIDNKECLPCVSLIFRREKISAKIRGLSFCFRFYCGGIKIAWTSVRWSPLMRQEPGAIVGRERLKVF
jgi:hypothetical protein